MTIFITILFIALFAVGFFILSAYNKLVRLRNGFKNAFAQIDVQLQRRFDLIPNLVETAKSYMAHESQTLEAVISARNIAQNSLNSARQNPEDIKNLQTLSASQGMLDSALSRLMMVSEAYPDLKANQNMAQLSEELTSTENKVAFARQAFNDSVMTYNNHRESFPVNIIATSFGFDEAALLELPKDQESQIRQAPKVSFN